jgi:hypothetical protein
MAGTPFLVSWFLRFAQVVLLASENGQGESREDSKVPRSNGPRHEMEIAFRSRTPSPTAVLDDELDRVFS